MAAPDNGNQPAFDSIMSQFSPNQLWDDLGFYDSLSGVQPHTRAGKVALELVQAVVMRFSEIHETKDDLEVGTEERREGIRRWSAAKECVELFQKFCEDIDNYLPHPELDRPSSFTSTVEEVYKTNLADVLEGEYPVIDGKLETLDKAREAFLAEPYDHFRQGSRAGGTTDYLE